MPSAIGTDNSRPFDPLDLGIPLALVAVALFGLATVAFAPPDLARAAAGDPAGISAGLTAGVVAAVAAVAAAVLGLRRLRYAG